MLADIDPCRLNCIRKTSLIENKSKIEGKKGSKKNLVWEARQHITVIRVKTDMLFNKLMSKTKGQKYSY